MKVPRERSASVRVVERVDHRQAVVHLVGQADGEEVARAPAGDAAVDAAAAILDDAGVDVAVLDHHRVVEHRHVGHAAVRMARVEVAAEQGVLVGGGPVRRRPRR